MSNTLSLKIEVKSRPLDVDSEEKSVVVRTMQFDGSMIVYDVINIINERLGNLGGGSDHGLFRPSSDDETQSIWLGEGRTLNSYDLKKGDLLEFKKKTRTLRVRLMDDSEKVVMIDESAKVIQILRTVCEKVGLTNPAEFGFTVEYMSRNRDDFAGIYEKSKKEKKAQAKNQEKVEKLATKAQAENEVNWLNPEKTLREQGVGPMDKVILRKKYYFHDQQLDPSNTVLINLMYVQARDDIVLGKHPCSIEEAVQFGGLQTQIEHGPHHPETHKPGFLDLPKFLPIEYVKDKSVEKKIYAEHRKNIPLQPNSAKYRYVQLCRSLKTYGTTFFLVKETAKGKQKLTPVLLGVSRDNILKADQRTKRILVSWKLTQVLRWAAGANHFTLDFGDDRPRYTVQTTEGESISRLISGYIDFHVDKKYDGSVLPPADADTTLTNIETTEGQTPSYYQKVPNGARYMQRGKQHMHSNMSGGPSMAGRGNRLAIQGRSSGKTASNLAIVGPGGQYGEYMDEAERERMLAQQALIGNIQAGFAAINSAQAELNSAEDFPPMGDDPSSIMWKKQNQDIKSANVASQLSALAANTANILMLNSGKQDAQAMLGKGSAVVGMSGSLTNLTKDVRRLAALADDENDAEALLNAARDLAEAANKLFQFCDGEQSGIPTVDFYKTADQVHSSIIDMLHYLPRDTEVDEQTANDLMNLARAVVDASKGLFKAVIEGAVHVENGDAQKAIRVQADQMTAAAVSFGKATTVLAPTINNLQCQESLIACAQLQLQAVNGLVDVSESNMLNDKAVSQVQGEAIKVKSAIAAVVARSKNAGIGVSADREHNYEQLARNVMAAIEGLRPDDKQQIDALNAELDALFEAMAADPGDSPEDKAKLMELAKNLKAAIGNLGNGPTALSDLHNAAALVQADARKRKALKDLEVAVKKSTMVCSQLVSAANNAQSSNRNNASKKQMVDQSHAMREAVGMLAPVTKAYTADRTNPQKQIAFINESKNLLGPGSKFVATTKVAVATVGDKAVAKQMANFSRASTLALKELREAQAAAAEACGGLEIDAAIAAIGEFEQNIRSAQVDLKNNRLQPLKGQEDVETCAMEVGTITKTIGSSMAQLWSAAGKGNENYVGMAARDTAQSLQMLSQSAVGIAALGQSGQQECLDATCSVLESSRILIEASKGVLADPNDQEKQANLHDIAKKVRITLQDLIHHLPGQRDLEDALRSIKNAKQRLDAGRLPPATGDNKVVVGRFNNAAKALNDAAAHLAVASRGSADQIADATQKYDEAFKELVSAGESLAAISPPDVQKEILDYLKEVCANSSKIIMSMQTLSSDQNNSGAKLGLAHASRDLQKALDDLLNLCSTAGPGVRECDAGARSVAGLSGTVGDGDTPSNDMGYFDCLNTVKDRTAGMGRNMIEIPKAAGDGDKEKVGENAQQAAAKMSELVSAAAQAAYLIGTADPDSVAAKAGVIDAQKVNEFYDNAVAAVGSLMSSNEPRTLFAAATDLKSIAQTLCTLCNTAVANSSDPATKQAFIDSRKAIASSVKQNELFPKIKSYATNTKNPEAKADCKDACDHLIGCIEDLRDLSGSPQYAAVPASISSEAKAKQEPVLRSTNAMISATSNALESAKAVATDPRDQSSLGLFNANVKAFNMAAKDLLNSMNENAPGLKECEKAISILQENELDLDHALVIVEASNILPSRGDNDLDGFQEMMLAATQDVEAAADDIRNASVGQQSTLGKAVLGLANGFLPLTASCLGAASKIGSKDNKRDLLNTTKKLAESAKALVNYAAKVNGTQGDEKSVLDLDNAVNDFRLDVQDLTRRLVNAVGDSGALTTFISQIERAAATIPLPPDDDDDSLMESIEAIERDAKALSGNIPAIAQADVLDLVTAIQDAKVVGAYNGMCNAARNAIEKAETEDSRTMLKNGITSVGTSLVALVQATKNLQQSPDDFEARKALIQASQGANNDINNLCNALFISCKGVHACESAVIIIDNLVNDLNTTSIFAQAGSLPSSGEKCNAKKLVEDVSVVAKAQKHFVQCRTSTQEALAAGVGKSLQSIESLVEGVKSGASGLGDDRSSQVLLINAAKDFTAVMRDLIKLNTKAVGKADDSPEAQEVSQYYDTTFKSALVSYGKTCKSLEDDLARGVRATEAAHEAIKNEVAVYDTKPAEIEATAENMLNCTRNITDSTSKLVSAAGSSDQAAITNAANNTRKAVIDLLANTKGATTGSEAGTIAIDNANNAVKTTATSTCALLSEGVLVHLQSPSAATKAKMAEFSKDIAKAVAAVTDAARELKGADLVDPDDPQVIAEKELLVAAAMIEEAARKLAILRPKETVSFGQDMKFEDLILTAAQQIMVATQSLMARAQQAQTNLKEAGRLSTKKGDERYHDDASWSEGLVSAAKEVGGATHLLCDAANACVQGTPDSDLQLIASAKAVSSSTQRLLHACRSRSEKNSKAMNNLDEAGAAVRKATNALVKAAQESSSSGTDVQDEINTMKNKLGLEMNLQVKILQREKEVETARKELERFRKLQYKK